MGSRQNQPHDISILPKINFADLLQIFCENKFEREVKIERFSVDFLCRELNVAFEYDGIQHYSVVQKIDSDKRKNELLAGQGISLIRWPYYFMPTSDVCRYIFKDFFSDSKYQRMLDELFNTDRESSIKAPGFHKTSNIPANFIWPGIEKFLAELKDGPASLTHQVRYSLQLYSDLKGNPDLVVPTHNEKFMSFFHTQNDACYLNYIFPNENKKPLRDKTRNLQRA